MYGIYCNIAAMFSPFFNRFLPVFFDSQVRCPTASMPQVSDMIRGLSPLARLEEMHPTLAKFSIPAGREVAGSDGGQSDAGFGRDEGRESAEGLRGLSLSKAFETIEARKAELEVGPTDAQVFVCPLLLYYSLTMYY